MRLFLPVLLSCALVLAVTAARAAEPVDKDLIPEARKVLDYLHAVYGQKVLSGMSSYGGWRPVYEMTGRAPAIYGNDAFGWNKPKWGESFRRVTQGAMDSAKRWWHEKGGIPQIQWHWGKPGDPKGSAWVGGGKGTGPVDVAATVTPGTPEHKAAMDDLARTADYLEQLAEARVPVLWRPLHEIDGGWFWWTDKETPENTAALWRMLFNYLVKERGLHNLIWVYSAGLHAGGLKRDAPLEEEIAYRKRFWPGGRYVDISGIDIYPNEWFGWGPVAESTYQKAFDLMARVSPGKMLALCEGAAIPNPDLLQRKGPGWLYALPWFAGGRANSPEWIRKTFPHDHILTLDELPVLVPHNVCPDVRLLDPADGAAVEAGEVRVKALAADRDGNLRRVVFHRLAGPWKNWSLRKEEDLREALAGAERLGEVEPAADGTCVFTWSGAPAGLHTLAAVAHDADGKTTVSNLARVTVGLQDLARGRTVTASSDEAHAPAAVDDDLFTAWSGKKKGQQWLAVDLGSEKTVAAVVLAWWKAYARAYRVEVSSDGKTWREVFRQADKRQWHGDTDVVGFEAVKARHVRLVCTKPGTNWGGYTVYALRVYTALPG